MPAGQSPTRKDAAGGRWRTPRAPAYRLAFWLTANERDALWTLDFCRAAWPNFSGRTWTTLAKKGLVVFGAAPALTVHGSAVISLTKLHAPLTSILESVSPP